MTVKTLFELQPILPVERSPSRPTYSRASESLGVELVDERLFLCVTGAESRDSFGKNVRHFLSGGNFAQVQKYLNSLCIRLALFRRHALIDGLPRFLNSNGQGFEVLFPCLRSFTLLSGFESCGLYCFLVFSCDLLFVRRNEQLTDRPQWRRRDFFTRVNFALKPRPKLGAGVAIASVN